MTMRHASPRAIANLSVGITDDIAAGILTDISHKNACYAPLRSFDGRGIGRTSLVARLCPAGHERYSGEHRRRSNASRCRPFGVDAHRQYHIAATARCPGAGLDVEIMLTSVLASASPSISRQTAGNGWRVDRAV
jgi:hypothetical protein